MNEKDNNARPHREMLSIPKKYDDNIKSINTYFCKPKTETTLDFDKIHSNLCDELNLLLPNDILGILKVLTKYQAIYNNN